MLNRNLIRGLCRGLVLDGASLFSDLYDYEEDIHISLLLHDISGYENEFEELIEFFIKNQFEFHSFSDSLDSKLNAKTDCKRFVSISFDDGLKSLATAVKILNNYSIKSIFFLNFISLDGSIKGKKYLRQRINNTGAEFLNIFDIEEMLSDGHEIGNHTFDHLNITNSSFSSFKKSFYDNHDLLERTFYSPKHFAWPYGQKKHINQRAIREVYSSGYSSVVSGIRGYNPTKFIQTDSNFIYRHSIDLKSRINHIAALTKFRILWKT